MPRRRAPVERLVDLAVAIPVSSVVATRRLAPVLASAGRTIARGSTRSGRPAATGATSSSQGAGHGDGLASARAAGTIDGESPPTSAPVEEASPDVAVLPIDGYDQLAARQIIDRLAALTPGELDAVDAYERAHRNRSTVLGRIAQLRA